MKNYIIGLLLFAGVFSVLQAQDKVVLRNGRTIEVNIQRSLEDRIEYTYPGETSVYERPKTAVSYIQYENGRREVCDENYNSRSSRNQSSYSRSSRISPSDEIFWQDVKTTTSEAKVKNMKRIQRISATSNTSYKDAISKLKKKAASMGGTTILIMDEPGGENIEVMGIAYRDENMEYTPRSASERTDTPRETSSNVRRRRIARQMESYNNETNLIIDEPENNRSSHNNTRKSRYDDDNVNTPDAVYLMNGRVIRGTIEEFEPDDFVSIRTASGKVIEYSMDDVKRVSQGKQAKKATASKKKKVSRYDEDEDDDDDYYSSKRKKYDDDYYDVSESGYKGIFEAGYTLSFGVAEKGRIEVSTTHGYQINKNIFVGAGVGLHLYSARKPELKKNMNSKTYPQYADGTNTYGSGTLYPTSYIHAIDSSFMILPIFVEGRFYLPSESSFVPFASLKAGYSFNLSDSFGGAGIYLAPSVGGKIAFSPKLGFIFSLGYTFQGLGDSGYTKGSTTIKKGYGYYYYEAEKKLKKVTSASGVNLKIGIEF